MCIYFSFPVSINLFAIFFLLTKAAARYSIKITKSYTVKLANCFIQNNSK